MNQNNMISDSRYRTIKAILKILHPKVIRENDMKIMSECIEDYKIECKTRNSWFDIYTAIDRYKPLISPPKKIMDDAMRLVPGGYLVFIKEGIQFNIKKGLDDVSWSVA